MGKFCGNGDDQSKSIKPGENIFFYRDQNGVEIDFIVEKNMKLFLIEAKSSERIDNRKISFRKVEPLLAKKYKVQSVVAHNCQTKMLSRQKEYDAYNPLFTVYNF